MEDDDIPGWESAPMFSLVERIVMAAVLAVGLLLVFQPWSAWAHSWYDPWCCSGKDCAPIPFSAVREIQGGYQITLKPGDHPLVTRVHVFQIEQVKVKRSKDDQYHACLFPTEDRLLCFYAPAAMF